MIVMSFIRYAESYQNRFETIRSFFALFLKKMSVSDAESDRIAFIYIGLNAGKTREERVRFQSN